MGLCSPWRRKRERCNSDSKWRWRRSWDAEATSKREGDLVHCSLSETGKSKRGGDLFLCSLSERGKLLQDLPLSLLCNFERLMFQFLIWIWCSRCRLLLPSSLGLTRSIRVKCFTQLLSRTPWLISDPFFLVWLLTLQSLIPISSSSDIVIRFRSCSCLPETPCAALYWSHSWWDQWPLAYCSEGWLSDWDLPQCNFSHISHPSNYFPIHSSLCVCVWLWKDLDWNDCCNYGFLIMA